MSAGLAAVAHLADLLCLPQAQRDAIFALGEQELKGGQTEQAIETLQVAAHLDPLNPVRWRRLGEALRVGGRIPEANLYTQYALELTP
jgi:tetratricopeptide (TPR) repeat protein